MHCGSVQMDQTPTTKERSKRCLVHAFYKVQTITTVFQRPGTARGVEKVDAGTANFPANQQCPCAIHTTVPRSSKYTLDITVLAPTLSQTRTRQTVRMPNIFKMSFPSASSLLKILDDPRRVRTLLARQHGPHISFKTAACYDSSATLVICTLTQRPYGTLGSI